MHEDVHSSPNRFPRCFRKPLSKAEQDRLIELAIGVLRERHRPGQRFTKPADTQAYLKLRLAGYYNEVFGVMFLDNRHRLIADEELFQGTIDGASVFPRVVVQRALSHNAAAVILYHNHPSGVAEPSRADESVTVRLKSALSLVDTKVLDHVVVGSEGVVSFAERGLL